MSNTLGDNMEKLTKSANGQWTLEKSEKTETLKKASKTPIHKQLKSVGHIDVGENQIHEVMHHPKTNNYYMAAHGEPHDKDSSYVPYRHFMDDLKQHQPQHVEDVSEQLGGILHAHHSSK